MRKQQGLIVGPKLSECYCLFGLLVVWVEAAHGHRASESSLPAGQWVTKPSTVQAGELPAPPSWDRSPSHPRALTPPHCSRDRDNCSAQCVPLSWLGSPTPSKPLCSSEPSCSALPLPFSDSYNLTAPLLGHGHSSSLFTCSRAPGTKDIHYFPPTLCHSHLSLEDACPGRDSNPCIDEALAWTPPKAKRLWGTDDGPTRQGMSSVSSFKESSNLHYMSFQAVE